MKEDLFQCGGFLDMQIEMEPLVIDWAKEEPKMGQHIELPMVWSTIIFRRLEISL